MSTPHLAPTPDARGADETLVLRERTHTWHDPVELATAAQGLAGIHYLTALVDGDLPAPPICGALGFTIEEVTEGRAVLELVPAEHHYNTIGTVHGGVLVTLLDSAAGNAVHSTLPLGVGYTTIDLTTTFLRPVHSGTGRLRAIGNLVHAGRRVAVADAELVDDDGKLYARASVTCMILAP